MRVRVLLVAAVILGSTLPASARITRTRPSAAFGAPSVWASLYAFVLGAGLEYVTDDEQTEWGVPILIEYSVTERLRLILEPEFVSIDSKSPDVRSVGGSGDLEVAVDFEFLNERRYRPALSVEGRIKWPTASDPDLGEPGRDYTLGLLASKDLVFVDLGMNALYTFAGHREREDSVEISLAAEWHVTRYVDVIVEVANVTRVGRNRGGREVGRNETEATLGLAWHASKFLTFEQGIILREHGIWEAVFAWEWSIGGDY